MDLAGAHALCIHENTKIVVIGKHKDFVLIAFKIVLPCFKSLNNG